MKKTILLLMLVSTGIASAQVEKETTEATQTVVETLTKNQNRIAEIPNLIEAAVKAENYQEAANLQEELKIRKKIEVAQGNQDYKRVVELEEQLENCDCKPKPEQDCVAEKKAEYQKEQREKEIEEPFLQKRKFLINVDFSPAGYLHSNETYSQTPMNEVAPYNYNEKSDQFAVNHAVGASVFFGDMDKDMKIGLDINFMDVTMAFDEFRPFNMSLSGRFAFAQPGIIMTKYFSNGLSGLDIKANLGAVKAFGGVYQDFWGLNTAAQIKFWRKKSALGIKYQFGSGLDYDAHYHHVALVLGLRL